MPVRTKKAAAQSSGRPLLTWEGAAERLGTSVRHLKRIVYEPGESSGPPLPYVKVGGRVRFDPDQIDGWVAAKTVERGE